MAWRKIKVPATLENTPIVVHYNSDYGEYRVRITGKPEADYFTSDKQDAFATGQQMRNTGLKKNPAPKRKTAARTIKTATAYVKRPSQITKKAPTKRLATRRIKNLQVPRGVFPNPSSRADTGWGKMELQTIADAFDKGTMTVSTAKSRVWGYLGIDIKARTKSGFLKELAGHVYGTAKKNPQSVHFDIDVNSHNAKGAKAKTRTNPVSRVKAPAGWSKFIRVERAHGKEWEILSIFPKSGIGAENAIEYAKAFHAKEPSSKIRVIE